MFRISKEFHFSASHQLTQMPDDHPCARLHGHNYVVVLELQGEALNPYGFVRDYLELKAFKDYIDDTLDHRHLGLAALKAADDLDVKALLLVEAEVVGHVVVGL